MVRADGRVTSRRSRCVSSRWHKARKMGGSRLFKANGQAVRPERPRAIKRTSHRARVRWLDVHAPRAYSLTRLTPPGFCIPRFHRRTLPQHNTVPGGRVGPSRITPSSSTRHYRCFGHDTVCHTRDSERCLRVHERIPSPNTATTKHSNNETQQHNTRLKHKGNPNATILQKL